MGNSVPDLDQVGIKADSKLAHQFKQEVAHLIGRSSLSFPGSQPVSFASKHIQELQRRDYYVCEKTDGIRCLMYFARGGADNPEIHYLIDRKNEYRYVPGLHFPMPNDESFQSFHVDTLVDGELVNDTYDDGTEQLKYLAFDCLVLDGQSLMHRTLDKRLAYFKEMVLKPYNALFKRFPEEKEHRPFAVEDKSTQFSYGIEMMFREIIPKVKRMHGNDGLIFTCRSTAYKIGTDEHILKWKPPQENTVDFRLRLEFPLMTPEPDSEPRDTGNPDNSSPDYDYDAIPTAHLFVAVEGGYRHYGFLHLPPADWSRLTALNRPLDDAIVECFQDDANRWRFSRLRDDKDDANFITTVDKVMDSIRDRVSEEDLINSAPIIKTAWKKRAAEEDGSQRARIEEERRRRTNGVNGSATGMKRKWDD